MGLEQWRLCAPVLPTPGFSRAGTSPHLCVWIPSLTHSSHWFIYLAPAVCPALTDLLCLRQDLLAYLPKPLQWQVSMATIKSLIGQELRQLQGCSSQEAQIGFIEAVRQLPLFGYTVYVVLRVSQLPLPGPSFLGLNRQRLILMDPGSQTLCCTIALSDLHRLHLLSPREAGGPPGLELNYGSADSPRTIWLELPQAQELKHTIGFLLDSSNAPA